MADRPLVLFVHSVDTEGPLYESLGGTFERLHDLYGLSGIEATPENLDHLKRGEIPLGGMEQAVAQTLDHHRLSYNDTWEKIDEMLARVLAPAFRRRLVDSFGNGWIYNWFCVDHVGYTINPRRRDIGYHNIFDHYRQVLAQHRATEDGIHWHFHPMSTYREAHRSGTSYVNSPELYQILCRRIIEQHWFPSVFRAGFHVERPDSHWFLEQWIPFDLSNIAVNAADESHHTNDRREGSQGDWRLAPSDWSVYHPSHDNYQVPGGCRRWIGRILNVMNRFASINQREVDKAFARAAHTRSPVLVGMVSHDFRDLGVEVEHLMELARIASQRYPGIPFKYAEARDAFRTVIWPDGIRESALEFEVVVHPRSAEEWPFLEVVTTQGKVFGPQPFLAIEMGGGRFLHDNFDFSPSGDRWSYAFGPDTVRPADVVRVGVAANDQYGNVCVRVLDMAAILSGAGKPARVRHELAKRRSRSP